MDQLASLLAAAFRLLALVRGGRALHPVGVGYRARLEIVPAARRWAGTRLLVPGARYDALVRFSRGAGLPEPLPDALGVAVRLPDAYGPGRPQDFLATSSADLPLVRRLLFPARSFLRVSFSSALPYLVDGRRVVTVLRPRPGRWPRTGRALADLVSAAATGALAYELRLAGSLGRSRPVGVLTIGDPLDTRATEALRFNPWHTGEGIRPTGRLNRLRRPSYSASQQGRAQPRGRRPAARRRCSSRRLARAWAWCSGSQWPAPERTSKR
jgi:hypothetical protein